MSLHLATHLVHTRTTAPATGNAFAICIILIRFMKQEPVVISAKRARFFPSWSQSSRPVTILQHTNAFKNTHICCASAVHSRAGWRLTAHSVLPRASILPYTLELTLEGGRKGELGERFLAPCGPTLMFAVSAYCWAPLHYMVRSPATLRVGVWRTLWPNTRFRRHGAPA